MFKLKIIVNIYMTSKLAKIYYSPKGYWRGISAIKKLANIA